MAAFQDWILQALPAWAQGPWGTKWWQTVGGVFDLLKVAAKDAVKARWPMSAPDDAVETIGRERMIDRGPSESLNSHRSRVDAAWTTWVWAGTETGVWAGLVALGLPLVSVLEDFEWSAWDDHSYWSRFWVVIGPNALWTIDYWAGDGTLWGGADDTWGSTASPDQIRIVRRVIRKWRAAHAIPVEAITVWVEGDIWGPAEVWGADAGWGGAGTWVGTWGMPGEVWGASVCRWPLGNFWELSPWLWGDDVWGADYVGGVGN